MDLWSFCRVQEETKDLKRYNRGPFIAVPKCLTSNKNMEIDDNLLCDDFRCDVTKLCSSVFCSGLSAAPAGACAQIPPQTAQTGLAGGRVRSNASHVAVFSR